MKLKLGSKSKKPKQVMVAVQPKNNLAHSQTEAPNISFDSDEQSPHSGVIDLQMHSFDNIIDKRGSTAAEKPGISLQDLESVGANFKEVLDESDPKKPTTQHFFHRANPVETIQSKNLRILNQDNSPLPKDQESSDTVSGEASSCRDSDLNFEKTISEGEHQIGKFDFRPTTSIKVPLLELSQVKRKAAQFSDPNNRSHGQLPNPPFQNTKNPQDNESTLDIFVENTSFA